MKKTKIVLVAFIILTLIGSGFVIKNKHILGSADNSNQPTTPTPIPADKIIVAHFHGTHQCWSCKTVGEYSLRTLQEKFPEEFQSGKIIFKEINVDLGKNEEIVKKYQARGSSLYINAIRDGKDNISEDTTVWRLVNNQHKFNDYFANKIKKLLSK